eukprot:6173755-Pleurochrysis_carterae.AAC.1
MASDVHFTASDACLTHSAASLPQSPQDPVAIRGDDDSTAAPHEHRPSTPPAPPAPPLPQPATSGVPPPIRARLGDAALVLT